ncbi:hypothetical protein INR49_017241 [Caranx melampygus]|nr:hypothetical protein INR49_017241 [Caranx melampygus]
MQIISLTAKSLPCDTLMFLPTLRPFILEPAALFLVTLALNNSAEPPTNPLAGMVYFSPKVGGAEREGFASIPTIHQWLTELMKPRNFSRK